MVKTPTNMIPLGFKAPLFSLLNPALEKKQEVLGIFRKISDDYPEPMIYDQIELLEAIINEDTEKLTRVVDDMKERYICECCNELKKNQNQLT